LTVDSLYLVVRWSVSGLLLSGEPIAAGIDWAISIVIYETADLTSVFHSRRCEDLLYLRMILIGGE
jgi:hypothetical protein